MTRLVKLGWFKSLDKEKNWFLRSSLGSSSGGGFYAGRSQGTQGSSLTASGVTNLMGSSQGAQGWSSQSAGLRGSLLSSQTVFNPSQGAASFIGDGSEASLRNLDSTSSNLDGSAGVSRLLMGAQRKGGLPHVVPGLGTRTQTPAGIN